MVDLRLLAAVMKGLTLNKRFGIFFLISLQRKAHKIYMFLFFTFQILVKFLFHVVEMTANRVNTVTRRSFVNLGSQSEEVFLLKLFGCILTCLTHLLKSGLLWYQSL